MSTNLFAQFRRLLPGQPVLVATVISSASGSTVVEFPGGDRLTVRGVATAGTSVFVRGGAIEGLAPGYTATVILV